MVVRDVERDDVEFLSKALGLLPVAHVDHLRPDKLASADLVEEVEVGGELACFACLLALTQIYSLGRPWSLDWVG